MDCSKTGHGYAIAKSGYFKAAGGDTPLGTPKMDQTVEYAMLYCSMCGDTKEIVCADHRKKAA